MPASALIRRPWLGAAGAAILLAGCSGNESPIVSPVGTNAAKPAESITRQNSASNAAALTAQINTLRHQAFNITVPGDTSVDVYNSDVVYTAAYRHAVNLNTANSGNYQPNGALGVPIGAPTANITVATTLLGMLSEFPNGNIAIFPALFTNTTPYARVAAVVGSPSVLRNCQPSDVREWVVINGDISLENGNPSVFRGFNLYPQSDAISGRYQFTAVDNLWYTWRGRLMLSRYDTLYMGYGQVSDGAGSSSCICPPFPILNGQMLGVMTTVSQGSGQSFGEPGRLGFWPSNGATNVCPYGLDPDVRTLVTPAASVFVYCGPPISMTFPVKEPFRADGTGLTIGLNKVGGVITNGNTTFTAYWKGATGAVASVLATTGTAADFTGVSTTAIPIDVNNRLREGELIIIPVGPLEPNTTYRVSVRAATASGSYQFPDPPPVGGVAQWTFTTGNQTF